MARSRLYGWNGEFPEKPLSGQALIVFNGIKNAVDGEGQQTMLTGHAWAEVIGNQLATRQDPYRVVLYYILVLKNRGVIKTAEFDINATTRDESATVHSVTVKTEAAVVERFESAEEVAPDEETDEEDESDDEEDDEEDESDDEETAGA